MGSQGQNGETKEGTEEPKQEQRHGNTLHEGFDPNRASVPSAKSPTIENYEVGLSTPEIFGLSPGIRYLPHSGPESWLSLENKLLDTRK